MTTAGTNLISIESARARRLRHLTALEEVLDAGTVRQLEALGVRDSWRCLEVAAGAGSVARWLCERVGRNGHVLATDLDTRFVEAAMLNQRNGTTLRHNLLSDELPEGDFDLVHARLVLAWLPEPSRALAKLVAALKPGGWLVIEELDCMSTGAAVNVDPSLSATLDRVLEALERQLQQRGRFDSGFGRRLYGVLESAGLVRVHAEGRVGVWPGGSAGARLWRLTLEWLREPMANSGVASLEEIDRVIALCDDPRLQLMSPMTVAAWGRRPLEMAAA